MKNLKNFAVKLGVILVMTIGVNLAVAQGTINNSLVTPNEQDASAYLRKSGVFVVAIDNPQKLDCQIKVVDANGKVWYSENSRTLKIRKSLDLNNILDGNVKVFVKNGDVTKVYEVSSQVPVFAVRNVEQKVD